MTLSWKLLANLPERAIRLLLCAHHRFDDMFPSTENNVDLRKWAVREAWDWTFGHRKRLS
jgi:hypothetical protein